MFKKLRGRNTGSFQKQFLRVNGKNNWENAFTGENWEESLTYGLNLLEKSRKMLLGRKMGNQQLHSERLSCKQVNTGSWRVLVLKNASTFTSSLSKEDAVGEKAFYKNNENPLKCKPNPMQNDRVSRI